MKTLWVLAAALLMTGCATTSSQGGSRSIADEGGPSLAISLMGYSCADFLATIKPTLDKRMGKVTSKDDIKMGELALVAVEGFTQGALMRTGYPNKAYIIFGGAAIIECENNPALAVGQAVLNMVAREGAVLPDASSINNDASLSAAAKEATFFSIVEPTESPLMAKCSRSGGLELASFMVRNRRMNGQFPSQGELRMNKERNHLRLAIASTVVGLQLGEVNDEAYLFHSDVPAEKRIISSKQSLALVNKTLGKVCLENTENTIYEALTFALENSA